MLKLPAGNQGNTLRGAFGGAFRRLVCIPQCRDARRCPPDGTCPYQVIFESAPPPAPAAGARIRTSPAPSSFARRLTWRPMEPDVASGGTCPGSAGRPAPAALKGGATRTTYAPGQASDFTLTPVGKAVDYLTC